MENIIPNAEASVRALAVDQLYRHTDLGKLPFATTTAELQPVNGLVAQARAREAIRVGTRIDKSGFNLFVIGSEGARMQEIVKAILSAEGPAKASPSDWVYVNNFADPGRPRALDLPAGRAGIFQDAMHKLIDDLKAAFPAVFQSEDYQRRRSAIDEALQKKQNEAFTALHEKAAAQSIVILRTPLGFALAPAREAEVIPPEEFKAWPEAKRSEMLATINTLEGELERIIRQIPQWEKERRDEVRQLNRETAKYAVDHLIDDSEQAFGDLPNVLRHIETVRADLVDNVAMFFVDEGEEAGTVRRASGSPFDRYEVNILVAQKGPQPAVPVIEEHHPTLGNLLGRIEYMSLQGALVTNFRLIKAGALHRACGGYLLLDARSLLIEPFSWTALKRTLRRGEIAIEDVTRFVGLASTVSLEPDPIPLNLKVILFGDRLLYFLLAALDPELKEQFKVLADFEDDLARTSEGETVLAGLVASLAKRDGLKPLDRGAVGLILEHAARLAHHANKLTLSVEPLREVLIEADFLSETAKREIITRDDIECALAARIERNARLRDCAQEAILENVALIETSGTRTGQVNGISVTEFGGFAFGRPTRITCRVRPGNGEVVDIEREVELGGPLHSKGVLILSGFLAGRYALDTPMSLFASLVFEQSYGGVEGDSASSAELYALLSALADAPLRQELAITGSVNQHGEVQAIGGVNEKIEGFFDICKRRGLTGTQGVLIPKANVQHLMLRKDVVDACAAGLFAIFPIATIDEGIALLTGRTAGQRDVDGSYPAGSINQQIEDRLRAFALIRREFGADAGSRFPEHNR